MTRKVSLPIAVSVLLAGTSAYAANLVNRGGTSDVPTYQGQNRVYYIKPAGATCPTDWTCFCDTGSMCVLPYSLVTGTVVIDRPGVTLDCQNRTIQPPRYAGSRQECTSSSQCGQHSSGLPKHECVSGFCQLGGLGGINVGGPYGVDDGSININVNATGYVADVEVRNCVVRNHYAGYVVQGYPGDNGSDDLAVQANEFRTGQIGVSMYRTDSSYVWGNNVHDNAQAGFDFNHNWNLRVYSNTVRANGISQIYFHGDSTHTNKWLDVSGNFITSTFTPPTYPEETANLLVLDMQGTVGSCNSEAARCDLRIEANDITADDDMADVELRRSYSNGPTVVLRDNVLSQWDGVAHVVAYADFHNNPRCWNKGNRCWWDGQESGCDSYPSGLFTSVDCWY